MSHPTAGSSVLVVDDDFVLLEIVTTEFQRAGLTVRSASSGEAALKVEEIMRLAKTMMFATAKAA